MFEGCRTTEAHNNNAARMLDVNESWCVELIVHGTNGSIEPFVGHTNDQLVYDDAPNLPITLVLY